jgi:hypothetical protein
VDAYVEHLNPETVGIINSMGGPGSQADIYQLLNTNAKKKQFGAIMRVQFGLAFFDKTKFDGDGYNLLLKIFSEHTKDYSDKNSEFEKQVIKVINE